MELQADHQVQYFPLSELKITPNLAGRVPKSLNQQNTAPVPLRTFLFCFFYIIIYLAKTFICQTLAVEL